MNDSEARELIASLAVSQKQTDKQLREAQEAALAEGWYLVHVGDEIFHPETHNDFQPRIYRAA